MSQDTTPAAPKLNGRQRQDWPDAWGTPEPTTLAPVTEQDHGHLAEHEYGSDLVAGDAVTDVITPAVDGHLLDLGRPGMPKAFKNMDGVPEPVLPPWATDPVVALEGLRRAVRKAGRWAAFRAVRSPWDALKVAWFAVVGVLRLTGRLTYWVLDIDGHPLVGDITARDDRAYVRMAHDRSIRQRARLTVVGVGILLILIASTVLVVLAPWWITGLAVVVVVVLLARAGAPAGVRLISPAVQRETRIPLTSQSIVRALDSVGITKLSKALAVSSNGIWRSSIVAVRGGHQVHIQLPMGVLAEQLIPHEQRLAHALGRQADTVIVELLVDKTPGDLLLHVRDAPALSSRRGPGPLVKARKTSWWTPVTIGVSRLGVPFPLALRGGAWFIGGQPAAGKSSLIKIAAAHTALDPYAHLTVINLKGSPDYAGLKPVCHRYLSGSPETDPQVIPAAVHLLQEVMQDVAARNDLLSRLVERGKATTNDVTEELAKAHPALRPHTIVIDEAHRLFDTADNPAAETTADLIGRIIKACRSVGVTLIAATQLAGGESVPAALPRASRIRGCLKVQDEVSFRQIFGNTGPGVFAASGVSALPAGTVLLKADDGGAVKVGTYLLEVSHMADIGKRALGLRESLDLLTGDAAGDQLQPVQTVDPADLLQHVLRSIPHAAPVGGRDDAGVAWLAELEIELLADHPAVYGDRAPGWLTSELRARGVPTAGVNRRVPNDDGSMGQRTTVGVRADAVRVALERLLTADER